MDEYYVSTIIDEEELLNQLRNAADSTPKSAHNFFRQFGFNIIRSQGNHGLAIAETIRILEKCKKLDLNAYQNLHKGTPYYWIAISSFIIKDFQTAAYFFDAAAKEDLLHDKSKKTPALLFMILNSRNPNQAARDLTYITERQLSGMIKEYNKIHGAEFLSIAQVRTRFLKRSIADKQNWRTLVTSLISFILEKDYRLQTLLLRTEEGSWEPFYLHLFKGCILFESLLKVNPDKAVSEDTLGKILCCNKEVRTSLHIKKEIKTKDIDFPTIINNIPDTHDIQDEVEFVAQLRNVVGHNLCWNVTISPQQYYHMVLIVGDACLHVISTLYK